MPLRLLAGRRCALLAAASVLAVPAIPQAGELTFSGSVRLRQETLDGQFRPGFARDDDLLSSRIILGAQWREGAWTVVAELFDSRALAGEERGALTTGEVNALEPVQLYVLREFTDPFGTQSSATVQLGRFDMSLGSRRLVSSDDYRNTTNGYTGVRADLAFGGGTELILHYTLPQHRLPDDIRSMRRNDVQLDRESPDAQVWGALLSRGGLPLGLTAELGYVGFRERDSADIPTRDHKLQSYSLRFLRTPAPGNWDHELEAILQTGDVRASLAPDASSLDVDASFLHAEIGRTFAHRWKTRVALEYDRASGDGRGPDYGRFDTLFGMRRAELGPSGIYGAIGRTNLETLAVRIEAVPTGRLDTFTAVRALWAASSTDSFSTTGVRDITGASGSFAGWQVEARVRYWIVPQRLRAEFSGAALLKGDLLRDAPNAPPWGNTVYLAGALTLEF